MEGSAGAAVSQGIDKDLLLRHTSLCGPSTPYVVTPTIFGGIHSGLPTSSLLLPVQQQHQHQHQLQPVPASNGSACAPAPPCPPLPPFLTALPDDYVQDSEWAEVLVRLELGTQVNAGVRTGLEEPAGCASSTTCRGHGSSATTTGLEAVLQRRGSEGDSEALAALDLAQEDLGDSSNGVGGGGSSSSGSSASSSARCRGRRRSCSWMPEGRGAAGGHVLPGEVLRSSQEDLQGPEGGNGRARGAVGGAAKPRRASGARGMLRRGTSRSTCSSSYPMQQQLTGFQQQLTHAAKLQCRGIKGASAVARQNNAILQRLDARLGAHMQSTEQMQQLVQAASQVADWAQQVHSLSRELGVWKNECSNKHELWIRATELLQDREHQLLVMQSELVALQQQQRASSTNNDKELLHHSQHELLSVTEALLASQNECKALQQALAQQQRQQQHPSQAGDTPLPTAPATQPAADRSSTVPLPPLPPFAVHRTGPVLGDQADASRLVSVPLTPAPSAGRRSSDGSGSLPGDPDLVIAGGVGGGGGVVAEALVNAHMSELTQSSGTTRTKEVDRVIRRSAALLKKFVEKNNVQMRDREQRIAELKKRCRELEAALEALTSGSGSGAEVAAPGASQGAPDVASSPAAAHIGTAAKDHGAASGAAGAAPHSGTAARGGADRGGGSGRGAAVARAVALLQQQGPSGVRQRHVGVQATAGEQTENEGSRRQDGLQGAAGPVKELLPLPQEPQPEQERVQVQPGAELASSGSGPLETAHHVAVLESQLAEAQAALARARDELVGKEARWLQQLADAKLQADARTEALQGAEVRCAQAAAQLSQLQASIAAGGHGQQAEADGMLAQQDDLAAAAVQAGTATAAGEDKGVGVAELASRLEALQAQLQEAQGQAQVAREAQEAAQAQQRQLAGTAAQVAELQAQLQEAQQQLAARLGVEVVGERLTAAEAQAAELHAQLQAAQQQAATSQAWGAEQAAAAAAQEQQREAAEAHAAQEQELRVGLAASLAAQATQLAAAETQLAELRQKRHAQEEQAAEVAAAGAARTMAKLVETEARLADVQAQAQEHAAQAEAAQARVAELEAELAQALAQQQQQQGQQQRRDELRPDEQQQQQQQQLSSQAGPPADEPQGPGCGSKEHAPQAQPLPGLHPGDAATMQLVLAQSRVAALEAELTLMQQRMQSLITLARSSLQGQQLNAPGGAKDSPPGAVAEQQQNRQQDDAGAAAGDSKAPEAQRRGEAVLSLLGVLRGMEAMHTQRGGVDASLQRVRLLQGQMESVLLATLGHSSASPAPALAQAVGRAARAVGLPMQAPAECNTACPWRQQQHQRQQQQQQQQQWHSGEEHGAGTGPGHGGLSSSTAVPSAPSRLDHLPAAASRGSLAPQPQGAWGGGLGGMSGAAGIGAGAADDLLQGLEDNDWDHLPTFTPPPDFS